MTDNSIQPKNITHRKGLLGELEFTIHLIKAGWKVYRPFDQNSRVDLVIEKEGVFKRLQVKYCTPYRGCLRVELEHPMRRTLAYSTEEVDDIAAFDSKNNKFYLIPLADILPKKEIWIRVEESKSQQRKNMNLGEKYSI